MRKKIIAALVFCATATMAQNVTAPSTDFVVGKIHELNSLVLNEKRTLNVYLPDGYNVQDTVKYPVIYALDGSANEDFLHICGLVQFFTMQQMMPKTIVVGIANVDRKRDFTFPTTVEADKKQFPTTGGSAKFIGFLEQEALPFIAQNYKTTTTKTLIGQSLGGLLASEILHKKSDLFTHYIIVSPSLWWDNESLLPKLADAPIREKTIYVGVGKEGAVMENDAKKLSKILKKKPKVSLYFDFLPKENHATILHQAVYNAFKMFYKK